MFNRAVAAAVAEAVADAAVATGVARRERGVLPETSGPPVQGGLRLDAGAGLRVLVDLDEAQVVVGDLLGAPRSRSRSPSRKPFSASHQIERPIAKPTKPSTGAACCSQWSTLSSRGAAAEQHADDALAALAVARLLGEHLGVGALVDALDLPDVDLDADVLDVLDRAAHQLGPQLGVVAVGVAADRLELLVGGRHQQLEEELAVVARAASRRAA